MPEFLFSILKKNLLDHCPTGPNLIDGRKYMEVSQLLVCCSVNARLREPLLAERVLFVSSGLAA